MYVCICGIFTELKLSAIKYSKLVLSISMYKIKYFGQKKQKKN